MTTPTVTGIGTPNSGTTAPVTYTNPAHVAGDILVLAIECGQTTGVPTPPTGWAHFPNSPRAQGSNVTAGNLMWIRTVNSSEPNPVVAAQANHQVGFVIGFRGCVATGNPYDTGGQGVGSNLNTAWTVTGTSTTLPEELVVVMASSATSSASDQFGAFTDASLSSITKQTFFGTISGNGGSVDLITGIRSTAGATGTMTATQASSSQWTGIMVSLLPVSLDEAISLTDTISSAATVGTVATAAIALTCAITAGAVVGTQSSVSVPLTATITAAASVGGGSLNADVSVPLTDTIASQAVVGVSSGSSLAETAAITSGAQVGKVAAASLAPIFALTSQGVVGVAAGAPIGLTFAVSSQGVVGKVAGASVGVTFVVTATASVQSGGPSVPYIDLTIPARLGTLVIPETHRTLTIGARRGTLTIGEADRTLTIPAVTRTLTIGEV